MLQFSHASAFASSDEDAARCSCAVCRGAVTVVEADPRISSGLAEGPQAYLNADARDSIGPNGKPSYSISEAASQIVRHEPGWSSALGVGYTVTYAFRANEPTTMPSDVTGFSRFNAAQIAQAELALKAWADVANIKFTRVGSGTSGEAAYSDSASILFANYSKGEDGASAFAYNPGNPGHGSPSGDVWINSSLGYNLNPGGLNYGAQVLLHETGHAIGLAHPSEYNAGKDATITYSGQADYYEDSRQYTVMSYFSETNTGASFGGAYAASPLLDDIAAAQLEYGANLSSRTGDTIYGFNSTAERPWFAISGSTSKAIFAVWDAGGKDTLDFSGYYQNQTIDLREGFFSDVGGLKGNVAIAVGARIEGARGGSGADVIHGNALSNEIFGGAGNDRIDGGPNGSNLLWGDDGADTITGGSGFDNINGNKGADLAHGGLGDDWVSGGQDNDYIYGDEGADVVLGNMGNDTCEGGVGADTVRGGQHDDILYGQDGDDWLSGDRGSDTITGGAGADIFHSFSGAGIDRVTDFSLAQGDRILLDAGTPWSVAQVGSDTVISLGEPGDQIILVGVQSSTLSGGWIFSA
ncbi:M10 family metallopeptidase C-terminal domain-containing protein [Phenylobacterium deserti]|uniref:Serine 3-dehydrogenase n=1 Tax=Phenylobacterium deserti TaxID=1914756 RepID=A0A328AUX9_9CAUL|nr:M10 family metallopeptidase C-terminal domain-containing protein [Phenylobacterium deserti]RAK57506.1 serine 3-dehydrogenase [Phenylobacterium deserti]